MRSTPSRTLDSGLRLGIPGFTWRDLQSPARLADLLRAFEGKLWDAEPALAARYLAWRDKGPAAMTPPEESALLVALAAVVSGFVGRLFGVEPELARLRAESEGERPIF